MRSGRLLVLTLAALGMALGLASGCTATASSAAPGSSRQMVFWPLVTDGVEYRRVPYPREAGSLRVLADTPVVFDVRSADVSFWPITRQHITDFARASEFISGAFEIVDAGGRTTVVEPQPFVEWRPDGVGRTGVEIIVGDEAHRVHERYVQNARAAVEASREYGRQIAEREAAFTEWLRQTAEDPDLDLPAPEFEELDPPEPYVAYATEPRDAAVTSLPEGRYTIRLRGDDGQVIEGTEREVVSFGPLARGTGYVLIPEHRWTQPASNHSPGETVYVSGTNDLFFSPVPVEQYNAGLFARLFYPQLLDPPDPSATVWVARQPADEGSLGHLALWRSGKLVETLPETGYVVSQVPGATRGYVIDEAGDGEGQRSNPDFHGMRVPGDLPGLTAVSLRDSAGEQVPGTVRRIREFRLENDAFLFLPAALPLALALVLRPGSRRR